MINENNCLLDFNWIKAHLGIYGMAWQERNANRVVQNNCNDTDIYIDNTGTRGMLNWIHWIGRKEED